MKARQRARLEITCFVKLDLSNTKFGRQARAAVIIFEANITTGQNEGERESKQVEAMRTRRNSQTLPWWLGGMSRSVLLFGLAGRLAARSRGVARTERDSTPQKQLKIKSKSPRTLLPHGTSLPASRGNITRMAFSCH